MDERFQCWAFPFRVQMYKCKVHFNYCKEITSESFSQYFCNYWRLLLAEGSQDKGSFEPLIHSTRDLKTSPYTIYMSTYAFPCDFSVSLVYDWVYVWWGQEWFFFCLVFGFLLILDTVTHQAHLIFILNTATAPTNKLNPFLYAAVLFPLG